MIASARAEHATLAKTPVVARTLITDELFQKLVNDVLREDRELDPACSHRVTDRGLAERIVDQAIAFIASADPDKFLRPSKRVDKGWHAFFSRTREYADFTAQHPGWFVHHDPDVDPAFGDEGRAIAAESVAVIRDAGFVVDLELWDNAAACGESGCGAGRPPASR